MKKQYHNPEVVVMLLARADVLTASAELWQPTVEDTRTEWGDLEGIIIH